MNVNTEVKNKPDVNDIVWDCEDGINVAYNKFWKMEDVNDMNVTEKLSSLMK